MHELVKKAFTYRGDTMDDEVECADCCSVFIEEDTLPATNRGRICVLCSRKSDWHECEECQAYYHEDDAEWVEDDPGEPYVSPPYFDHRCPGCYQER